MSERSPVLVATCVCGGWVMVASLDYAGKDTFAEAGELAAMGFSVKTPVTSDDFKAMSHCEHRGDCTTDPEKVRVKQLELIAEAP